VGYDDEAKVTASRVEARFIGIVIAIAGALGYLWLNNTWSELQRLRDEIAVYRSSAEQTYAQKEMVRMIDERFTRVERRIEERMSAIEEFHRDINGVVAPGKGRMQ
jgi:hypothetical protein